MVSSVLAASPETTIKEIAGLVEGSAGEAEIIEYVYIVEGGILKGVLSLKDVLASKNKDAKAKDLMEKNLVVAHPTTPQERIVYLALSRGVKAIPVADKDGRFLGAVPFGTILQIFNDEVHEDTFKFGGIFHRVGKEITTISSPVPFMIKARIPWLILGVLGGLVAASVVSGFEAVLSEYLMLAAFIPVLVYLSDAVGTQSETLIVRGLAIDPKMPIRPYILRELKIAGALAFICALLLGAAAAAGWGFPFLGLIVGLSMFLSIMAAMLISTLLPLLFRRMGADPAVASGPFATLVSDIATIIIYFQVATMLLQRFGYI